MSEFREEKRKKVISIIYASETGNSEDVAFSLFRRMSIDDDLLDCFVQNTGNLLSYAYLLEQKSTYSDAVFIFLLSTTGDGDSPLNFKTFWQSFLKKGLPQTLLSGCSYAVFGFGDSSYEKYNACARKFFVRMKQLGAVPIVDLVLGDDQAPMGYHQTLEPFLDELVNQLRMKGFQLTLEKFPSFRVNYAVTEMQDRIVETDCGHSNIDPTLLTCRTIFNRRLSSNDWFQDIRWIRLEGNALSYESGDVAVVYYRNRGDLVSRALKYFSSRHSWLPTTKLSVSRKMSSTAPNLSLLPEVEGVSFQNLFEYWLEIGGIPKPSYFALLAQYTTIEEERDKLLELSSKEGIDLYYQFCFRERRNYIDILEEFSGVNISLVVFLEGCPKLVPRKYSIASFPTSRISSACANHQLDLCFAVAEYITPLRKKKYGLCTQYLGELRPEELCYLKIEKGLVQSSNIKKNWLENGKPLICIGPGTGIAPIRSLTHDLLPSNRGDKLVVFFGCRKADKDNLFSTEWSEIQENFSDRFSYFSAFSQEQLLKRYVTHSLIDRSKFIAGLLQQGAGIFISGSAKRMPQDVKRALIKIITNENQVSEEVATQQINSLIARKEYIVDAW